MATVLLINPNLLVQKNDRFTTGVIYMPVSLAYFAGQLKREGISVAVVDAFGERPNQWWEEDGFMVRGLTRQEVLDRVSDDIRIIVLYAVNLTYHRALLSLMANLREKFPQLHLMVMENTQAVTSYSLRGLLPQLKVAGADTVITGEAEIRGTRIIKKILRNPCLESVAKESYDGIAFCSLNKIQYRAPTEKIKNLDELAFAAWEEFPLAKYWGLHYAHGPQTKERYLPILTSRGCPYSCRFCVIPELNDTKWRYKSGEAVAKEMAYYHQRFGVEEFHIEDVNPTVQEERTRKMCQAIIDLKLPLIWKIAAGTKVETMRKSSTVELLARAGCRYISISPESGSKRVMKLINKPFNLNHSIKLIHEMNRVGIFSQACFVLGFPGENASDRELTRNMVKELTREGLDEVALFIVTPVPGSGIYDEFKVPDDYSELNFSPTWRKDYDELNRFRLKLYRWFLIWKLIYHPFKILRQPLCFLRRKFHTKMEMVPYKALHTYLMSWGVVGKKLRSGGEITVSGFGTVSGAEDAGGEASVKELV
jgi:anaerobic magnesium-protoporphyrin IX monomethyl ester cyclase